MTTNYHTQIALGAPDNAATFNAPLSELDTAIGNVLSGANIFSQLNLGILTNYNIASGSIAPTVTRVKLTSETGVTDTLDTMTGGVEGDLVILQAASGHTITLTHNAGTDGFNFNGGADLTLSGNKALMLLYDATVDRWLELAFGAGGQDILAIRFWN